MYWVKIKDIEKILDVSNYKAKIIFKEFRKMLNDEKLNQLDKSRLPRDWFISEAEKKYGISIDREEFKQ